MANTKTDLILKRERCGITKNRKMRGDKTGIGIFSLYCPFTYIQGIDHFTIGMSSMIHSLVLDFRLHCNHVNIYMYIFDRIDYIESI